MPLYSKHWTAVIFLPLLGFAEIYCTAFNIDGKVSELFFSFFPSFFLSLSVLADSPFHGQISLLAGDMAISVGTDHPRNAGRVIPAASRQREEKPSSRTPVSFFFVSHCQRVENAWDFWAQGKVWLFAYRLGFSFFGLIFEPCIFVSLSCVVFLSFFLLFT
jgi:hypothetical protein